MMQGSVELSRCANGYLVTLYPPQPPFESNQHRGVRSTTLVYLSVEAAIEVVRRFLDDPKTDPDELAVRQPKR